MKKKPEYNANVTKKTRAYIYDVEFTNENGVVIPVRVLMPCEGTLDCTFITPKGKSLDNFDQNFIENAIYRSIVIQ